MSLENRKNLLNIINNINNRYNILFNKEHISCLLKKTPKGTQQCPEKLKNLKLLLSNSDSITALYDKHILENMNFDELLKACKTILLHPVSKAYYRMVYTIFEVRSIYSLTPIATDLKYEDDIIPFLRKYKLTLSEAETIFKELQSQELNVHELSKFKSQIASTKEWAKISKKKSFYLVQDSSCNISYRDLIEIIEDGINCYFISEELINQIGFDDIISSYIKKFNQLINKDIKNISFIDYENLYNTVEHYTIQVNEFDFLKSIVEYYTIIKNIGDFILSLRRSIKIYVLPLNDIAELEKYAKGIIKGEHNDLEVLEARNDENCVHKNKNKKTSESNNNINNNLSNIIIPVINDEINSTNDQDSRIYSSRGRGRGRGRGGKVNLLSRKRNHPERTIENKEICDCDTCNNRKRPNANFNPHFVPSLNTIDYKAFKNLSNFKQLAVLSAKTAMKKSNDDIGQFCICREGDDEVNNMVQCESCLEWFHSFCIKLPKEMLFNDTPYFCEFCRKRKDLKSITSNNSNNCGDFNSLLNIPYSNHIKKVSLSVLNELLKEMKALPVEFEEYDKIYKIREEYHSWIGKYHYLITELLPLVEVTIEEFTNYFKEDMFNEEQYINKIRVLFLESEIYPITSYDSLFLILIVKHIDWFAEVYKVFNSNKITERGYKKLNLGYDKYFLASVDKELNSDETRYLELVREKAKVFYLELEKVAETNL